MRKIRALAVVGALLSGLAVTATAVPAHADTLRNVYYSSSDCYRYGDYGVQNHMWTWYHCDYQYNFWFLYSVP